MRGLEAHRLINCLKRVLTILSARETEAHEGGVFAAEGLELFLPVLVRWRGLRVLSVEIQSELRQGHFLGYIVNFGRQREANCLEKGCNVRRVGGGAQSCEDDRKFLFLSLFLGFCLVVELQFHVSQLNGVFRFSAYHDL